MVLSMLLPWESFDGDRGMAHKSVDLGGDSVIDYELPIGYIGLTDKWFIPSLELQEVYQRYAVAYDSPLETNATAERVQLCSDFMFIGRFADALFLGLEYPKYSRNDSFLLDQLHEYYYGGLPNMAQQTVRYWDQIIAMYERGTNVCTASSNNPYYLNCTISPRVTHEQQKTISYIRSASSGNLPLLSNSLPSRSMTLKDVTIPTGLISNQSYAAFGHATPQNPRPTQNPRDLVLVHLYVGYMSDFVANNRMNRFGSRTNILSSTSASY